MRRDQTSADPRVQRDQLEQARRELQRQREEDVRIEEDRRLVLRSPDGTYWSVTVNDAGALATTNLGTTL